MSLLYQFIIVYPVNGHFSQQNCVIEATHLSSTFHMPGLRFVVRPRKDPKVEYVAKVQFAKLCLNTRWFGSWIETHSHSWSHFFTLRVCRKFAWCDVKKSEDERLEWGWSCRNGLFIISNFTWYFFISTLCTLLCLFSWIYFVLSPFIHTYYLNPKLRLNTRS